MDTDAELPVPHALGIALRAHAMEPAAEPERPLTVEDVARRLAEIHAAQDDPEMAHSMEDRLYRDVLAAVAAGTEDAPMLAAAALRSHTLDFDRWVA